MAVAAGAAGLRRRTLVEVGGIVAAGDRAGRIGPAVALVQLVQIGRGVATGRDAAAGALASVPVTAGASVPPSTWACWVVLWQPPLRQESLNVPAVTCAATLIGLVALWQPVHSFVHESDAVA